MYLWQDHGLFGVFDPERVVPRRTRTATSRGRGAWSCDVIPDGEDMVAGSPSGSSSCCSPASTSGTGRACAVGDRLRDPAQAGPFAFNMSLHKFVGLVVFVPLLVIAFTGLAFGSPT